MDTNVASGAPGSAGERAAHGIESHEVAAARGCDRIRADSREVRPDDRANGNVAIRQSDAENRAPHAASHEQADGGVNSERDTQPGDMRVTDVVGEGPERLAKRGDRLAHGAPAVRGSTMVLSVAAPESALDGTVAVIDRSSSIRIVASNWLA